MTLSASVKAPLYRRDVYPNAVGYSFLLRILIFSQAMEVPHHPWNTFQNAGKNPSRSFRYSSFGLPHCDLTGLRSERKRLSCEIFSSHGSRNRK